MKEPQQSQNRKWRWFKPEKVAKVEDVENVENLVKVEDVEKAENVETTEKIVRIEKPKVLEPNVSMPEQDLLLDQTRDKIDDTVDFHQMIIDTKEDLNFNQEMIDTKEAVIERTARNKDLQAEYEDTVGDETDVSSCKKCRTEQVHVCSQDLEEVELKKMVVKVKNLVIQEQENPTVDIKVQEDDHEVHENSSKVQEENSPKVQEKSQNVAETDHVDQEEYRLEDQENNHDVKGYVEDVEVNKIMEEKKLMEEPQPLSKPDPAERLRQYLAFVSLWLEVHTEGEEGEAKKAANLVWRERIERGNQVSLPDYLEQTSILRSTLRQRKLGDSLADCDGAEFTCVGAQTSVQVAGCFNDWTPVSLTQHTPGEWAGTIPLAPGRYLYKYVVDGEWLVDPGKEVVTDATGNRNNQVIVEDRVTATIRQISETRSDLSASLSRPWKPLYPGLGLCPS